MITNEQTKEEVITQEEVIENELSGIEIENKRTFLRDTERVLAEANQLLSSDVYLLMQDDLNSMYQSAFSIAYSTEDAYKAKYALEEMKGIGKAMKVLDNLIIRLKDDADLIGNEILEMEK